MQSELTSFIVADIGDGFVRNAEGVFLDDFFITYSFLQFKSILFLEEVVIFCPGLIELLHLTFDALLYLCLLLIQLFF